MNLLRIGLIVLAAMAGCVQARAQAPMTEAKWEEDIAFYQSQLESNHIDLFHSVAREEFDRQINHLRSNLDDLTDAEILASLMRITRLVGDGHTAMPLWNSPQPRFPLDFRWIGGQAVITGASNEHSDLLGAVVEQWNGHPIDEVYAKLALHVPFVENAQSEAVRVAQHLNYSGLAAAIGLSDDPDILKLQVSQDGTIRTVDVQAIEPPAFRSAITASITYREDLSGHPSLIEADGIQFAHLGDGKVGYIQFDSYPSYDEMIYFASAAARSLDDANTRNLIIDFRENFGGDFFVGLALAANLVLLDKLDWQDGIYVLTSGTTFSAAMANAAQYSEILNAQIVGEPTGGNPCGYQDMGQFSLPHSGQLVTYSKRRYCFTDAVDDAISPDVKVSTSRMDYVRGSDPVLAWVLADIAGSKGVEATEGAYQP